MPPLGDQQKVEILMSERFRVIADFEGFPLVEDTESGRVAGFAGPITAEIAARTLNRDSDAFPALHWAESQEQWQNL